MRFPLYFLLSFFAGFEPQRGLGKGFPRVVGVTGVPIYRDAARGAGPLWKFAGGEFRFYALGRNPAPAILSGKAARNSAIENRK